MAKRPLKRSEAVQPTGAGPLEESIEASGPPHAQRFVPAALGIFVLALTVRLVHVAQLRSGPFLEILLGDAAGYDAWARRIAAGDWMGSEVFYQAPLYPYFLGVLYSLFSEDTAMIRIVQAVMGAVASVLIALATHRLFGRRSAIVAGVFLALYAPAVFFDGLIQKSSLDLLLMCLLLWLSTFLMQGLSAPRCFWSGFVLGCLSLTRENAVLFVPVFLVWLVWLLRRPAKPVLAFVLGLIAALAPIIVRNFAISGDVLLTTAQFGPNFYIGNHEGASGTYEPLRKGQGSVAFEQKDATAIAEASLGHMASPAQVSRYWAGQAFEWMRAHPADWLSLTFRKLLLALNRVEATDTEDLQSHAEWSVVLRAGKYLFHFGVLAPLGLLGLWITRARRRELQIFYALIVVYLMSVLVFYVLGRYRYLLVPLLLPFAGAGLAGLPSWLSHASAGDRVRGLVFLGAAILVCNWPLQSVSAMQAVTRYNLGDAYRQAGRSDDAVAEFRAALELDPNNPAALSNLGALMAERGDHTEALRLYERALEADPDNATAENNRGQELMLRSRTDEGIASFERSISLDPLNEEARRNLAMALAGSGRTEDAIHQFQEALRLRPDDAVTHNNLGIVFATSGRLLEARAHFEEALRITPGFQEAADNLKRAEDVALRPQPPARQ